MSTSTPGIHERILIVEDSAVQATLVGSLLGREGYQTRWIATIAEARQEIRTMPPDLLLLDRGLPDGDGNQLCRELKANPVTRDIPVILVTARDRIDERVEGLQGGADDYITKPYYQEELLARVRGCLRTHALQQEIRHKAEELQEKNRQLVETQARLVRAERLAAIGQIGLAIRHEINNPLWTIMGSAELLLTQREGLPPDVQKKLEVIHRGCVRIRDVLQRLQGLREDRTVEYIPGISMTDLSPGDPEGKRGGEP